MKVAGNVDGFEKIMRKLNQHVNKIEKRTPQGVFMACQLVKGESQKLCPVDTGNLINSAYVDIRQTTEGRVIGEVGYTAAYAAFVHENVTAHFQKPTAEPKFLEKAITRNGKEILRTIAAWSKV